VVFGIGVGRAYMMLILAIGVWSGLGMADDVMYEIRMATEPMF
jgi:hypothetical protein